MALKYFNPTNGEELTALNNGLLQGSDNSLFFLNSSGEIVPLISPIHGNNLIADANGLFRDANDETRYIINDGLIKPLIDPFSGGALVPMQDGTFQSLYTRKPFVYDKVKEAMIPLYVPDDSAEPAHIEGDLLVGNETGRSFEITSDGTILTPQEIAFRIKKQENLEHFDYIEKDGSIVDYLNQVKERIKNQRGLSKEEIADIIAQDEIISLLSDEEIKNIQEQLYPEIIETSEIKGLSDDEIQEIQGALKQEETINRRIM